MRSVFLTPSLPLANGASPWTSSQVLLTNSETGSFHVEVTTVMNSWTRSRSVLDVARVVRAVISFLFIPQKRVWADRSRFLDPTGLVERAHVK